MKKIFLAIIFAFFALGVTQAQEGTTIGYTPSQYYTFSWNMVFPMGDFNDVPPTGNIDDGAM